MNQCCGICKYFNTDGKYVMDGMHYDCDYPYYQVPYHVPYAVAFTQVTTESGEFCPTFEAKKDV
jgi:ectoine hydroxylase-related dioxygenase (phytanoyl-CoA dioxygenase family)